MIANQKRFQRDLQRHKRLISEYNLSHDKSLIPIISKLGEELTIACAEGRCENPKCKETKELTIHHVWQRKNKYYTNIHKYVAQRYYWADMMLLCKKCHAKIEERENAIFLQKQSGSIMQETIDRIKRKYGIMDEKLDVKLEKEEKTKVAMEQAELYSNGEQ